MYQKFYTYINHSKRFRFRSLSLSPPRIVVRGYLLKEFFTKIQETLISQIVIQQSTPRNKRYTFVICLWLPFISQFSSRNTEKSWPKSKSRVKKNQQQIHDQKKKKERKIYCWFIHVRGYIYNIIFCDTKHYITILCISLSM